MPYCSSPIGLSPPTRGNHRAVAARKPARRSIPAHAGEPDDETSGLDLAEVYPRPRGGTCRIAS